MSRISDRFALAPLLRVQGVALILTLAAWPPSALAIDTTTQTHAYGTQVWGWPTATALDQMAVANFRAHRFNLYQEIPYPLDGGQGNLAFYDVATAVFVGRGLQPAPILIRNGPSVAPRTESERASYAFFALLTADRYGPILADRPNDSGDFWRAAGWSRPGGGPPVCPTPPPGSQSCLPYWPIRTWEVWNEPNFYAFWPREDENGNPTNVAYEYRQLLWLTHDFLRVADPWSRVIFAGMNWPQGEGATGDYIPPRFYKRVINDATRCKFDAVGAHPYSTLPGNETSDGTAIYRMRQLRIAMNDTQPWPDSWDQYENEQALEAQIWPNEFGWDLGSAGAPPNSLNPNPNPYRVATPEIQEDYRNLLVDKMKGERANWRIGVQQYFALRDLSSGEAPLNLQRTGLTPASENDARAAFWGHMADALSTPNVIDLPPRRDC